MKPSASRVSLEILVAVFVAMMEIRSAEAIVAVERDFPDLVARAEQVVVGTVAEIREDRADGTGPFTYVTLDQLTVLKGEVGSTLVLRFAGGTDGDVASRITDMPTFTLGERALLFVAGNGRDLCPLVGIWQGRFRTPFDGERGTEIVEDHAGNPILGRAGRVLRRGDRSKRDHSAALSLDEFRQLVADELATPSR